MNPEKAAMRSIDNEKRSGEIERLARDLLRYYDPVSERLQKIAIDPYSLEDYDPEIVRLDVEHAELMKSRMEREDAEKMIGNLSALEVKKLANILEYYIYLGINKHNWIPFCKAIKTSDYDDVVNGVDLVVEYHNEERFGHMGLGVDVSFSQNLTKKFERIKREIDQYDGGTSRLGEVKYFKSEASGFSGRLFGMPRVVAALDLTVLKDMTTTMAPNHAASHALIIEMQHQLEVFRAYAEKTGSGCVNQIARAHAFMTSLSKLIAAESKLASSGYTKNRKIQDALEQGLEMFK